MANFITMDFGLIFLFVVLLSVLVIVLFENAGSAKKSGKKISFILRSIFGIVVLIITVSVVGSMGYVSGKMSDIPMSLNCRKPAVQKEHTSFISADMTTIHRVTIKTDG